MAVLVLPFWHDRWALLGFVISATTHGFIDRRCPVRWLLLALMAVLYQVTP
jgi:hypothetical protein